MWAKHSCQPPGPVPRQGGQRGLSGAGMQGKKALWVQVTKSTKTLLSCLLCTPTRSAHPAHTRNGETTPACPHACINCEGISTRALQCTDSPYDGCKKKTRTIRMQFGDTVVHCTVTKGQVRMESRAETDGTHVCCASLSQQLHMLSVPHQAAASHQHRAEWTSKPSAGTWNHALTQPHRRHPTNNLLPARKGGTAQKSLHVLLRIPFTSSTTCTRPRCLHHRGPSLEAAQSPSDANKQCSHCHSHDTRSQPASPSRQTPLLHKAQPLSILPIFAFFRATCTQRVARPGH